MRASPPIFLLCHVLRPWCSEQTPEFVATLLELGADRQIRNGLGELPEEIEATTLQAAEKLHEKHKAVELLRKKGVPVSASSS